MPTSYLPLFNGVNLFGLFVRFRTDFNPREEQKAAAPGVNGFASMDLGSRGKITTAKGVISAPLQDDWTTLWLAFATYQDGRYYPLVDNLGVTWTEVKLNRFRFTDEKLRYGTPLGFFRAYEAEFEHKV